MNMQIHKTVTRKPLMKKRRMLHFPFLYLYKDYTDLEIKKQSEKTGNSNAEEESDEIYMVARYFRSIRIDSHNLRGYNSILIRNKI